MVILVSAGKYVPAISYKIHQMNAQGGQPVTINLKGLLVGDGWSGELASLLLRLPLC